MRYVIFVAIIMALVSFGCSRGAGIQTNPTTPGAQNSEVTSSDSHQLWGLWQVTADPAAGTLDIVPLRTTAMHVNVVPILEPPAGMKLKIANLKFTGLVCDVDVTLVHPFPGLSQYIGFDVAGVFISKGTAAGFGDPDLMMAGSGETRMLNPDGYTRWWNPSEFSVAGQPILRYKDGMLGNKNSTSNFNCTLNGYKLFGDSLAKDDDLLSLTPSNRVPFLNGSANTRHYTIDFNGGVVFNYAVDANWEPIEGTPPFTPDEYVPEANRPEAWAVSITELENSLWNDGATMGGDLSLQIDVWDHFNAGLNTVKVESPGNFDAIIATTPIGGGEGYSTYQVDIIDATPKAGTIDLLVSVESEVIGYWDVLPDNHITSYFIHPSDVSTAQTSFAPTALMHATTSTNINFGDPVSFDATDSTGTPPLTFTWDFNGDGIYDGSADAYTGAPETPTHIFATLGNVDVTVKVTNVKGFDISDPVTVHVSYDPLDVFVDADYTGGGSDGTPSKPYLTIQEGMNKVTNGHTLHVDYFDGGSVNTYDTANLILKDGITLLGDNWNGGGPGKPKADNATNNATFSGSVTNFTINGFEIGMGEVDLDPAHYGVNFNGGSNITIAHNKFTDEMDDTGLIYGVSMPISVRSSQNVVCEFNDVGPMTWKSDTPGEYARVLFGIYFDTGTNIEINNNYVHDFTIDYHGGSSFEQIRMFCIHTYNCIGADIHNNLICHIEGLNNYSYRIQPFIAEAYYTTQPSYQYHNNTVDWIDNSQADPSYNSMVGLCIYDAEGYPFTDTWLKNELITNLKSTGSTIGWVESWGNTYPISYSTGYQLTSCSNYFQNLTVGDGCVNAPGVNPQYVNNTTAPYNYHFQSGSNCEKGDPNFIDWDDTGAPSGNPNETNMQNRSRMGCFGGPDGDWDPNNL
jgi:hypothetical protein